MTSAPGPGAPESGTAGAEETDPAGLDPSVVEPAATVEELLDRLRVTVEQARSLPMSSSVVVHRGDVLDLLAAVREVLPVQLDRAQGVVEHAREVMEEARSEGRAELERARAAAEELVSEQAVLTAARASAETLLAEARAEAARLLREADDYCDRRLADFEIDLDRIAQQVRRGRDKLRERAEAVAAPQPESPVHDTPPQVPTGDLADRARPDEVGATQVGASQPGASQPGAGPVGAGPAEGDVDGTAPDAP